MAQRFFGNFQVVEGNFIVRLVLSHFAQSLRFLQVLVFGVRRSGNFQQILVGLGVVAIAHKSHRPLHTVGEPVGFVPREADGLVVFHARLLLIAHQRVGIGETELRADKIRIDLERGAIMRERSLKVPRHAQKLAIRILRVGFVGEQCNIAIHSRKGLGKFSFVGIDICQIVQCGRKILVDGERLFEQALRLVSPFSPVSQFPAR